MKDQAGAIIAAGATEAGRVVSGDCQVEFGVASVPDAAFYSVEVGHRGAVTYSRDELAGRGWSVELTLGT